MNRFFDSTQDLHLSKNALTEAPAVAHLRRLASLDLRSNALRGLLAVPPLPVLASVFLGHNNLSEVSLTPSDALALFDAGSNGLRALPAALALCANLASIDASNNDLSELPPGLGHLPRLHRVALEGNPLRSIRRDVVAGGCEKLKAYLRTRGPAEKDGGADGGDGADPRALANGCRDAETRGVLDLRNRKLAAFPLDARAAAAIAADLDADDGLDAYVADARTKTARVCVVDCSGNDLREPPDARTLAALGTALSELKMTRNRLGALPLAALAALPLRRVDVRENAIDGDGGPLEPSSPLAASLAELDASSNRLRSMPASVFACGAVSESITG